MPDLASPVPVTIVSAGDGDLPQKGTVLASPGLQANAIVAAVVTPIAAIAIRFVNTFLVTLVGLVVAGGASGVISATDFEHLVLKCAGTALVPAGLGLLKDLVTVFGKLEGKYPLLTGSV